MPLTTGYVCPLTWNDLKGDGPRRFCGACQRHVIDLTDCGAAEARARIAAEGGSACGRYRVDALRRPLLGAMAAVGVATSAWAGPGDDAAHTNQLTETPLESPVMVMGEVAWSPDEEAWLDETNRERASA